MPRKFCSPPESQNQYETYELPSDNSGGTSPLLEPSGHQPVTLQHAQGFQKMLGIYTSEAANMIQMMIHQNNQVVERLNYQNGVLNRHLMNTNQLLQLTNQNQGNILNKRLARRRMNGYPTNGNTMNGVGHRTAGFDKDDLGRAYTTADSQYSPSIDPNLSKSFPISGKKKLQKQEKKHAKQEHSDDSSQYKKALRYEKQTWSLEQQHVLKFLNTYLVHNIKLTPDNQENLVEKKDIMDLYLQWKKLHLCQDYGLNAGFIQAILTNEFKSRFNVSAMYKGFTGVIFVTGDDYEDGRIQQGSNSEGEGEVESQQAQ